MELSGKVNLYFVKKSIANPIKSMKTARSSCWKILAEWVLSVKQNFAALENSVELRMYFEHKVVQKISERVHYNN